MRVTPHHLIVDFAKHVPDTETLLLAGDFGMKNHLEQKIAHFLGKLRVVAGVESIDDLVSFFN